jgi:cytochrome P450
MASTEHHLTARPLHVPLDLVRDFDFLADAALLAGPHAHMREIGHSYPPLFWTPRHGGHWLIGNHAMLAEVTADTERFSNRHRGLPQTENDIRLIPLNMDPPEHSRYRMPVNRYFSPRAVAVLAPVIRTMSIDLITQALARPKCNFLHEIAETLPVTLFMTMAGMPSGRVKEFRVLAEQATADPDGRVRERAHASIAEILADTVHARFAERQDDVISHLIDADIDGRKPDFEEVLSYAVLLFLGGLETVVNSLCFAALHLAEHPQLQAQLRTQPEAVPAAVEEFLRLYGIAMPVRLVTRDTELAGVELRKGDIIQLLIPAANYDAAVYPEPATFRLDRRAPHVTFNMGPHRCLGANLARLELRIFFEEWLRLTPTYRLDPDRPPRFIGGLNLAVRSLDLEWM